MTSEAIEIIPTCVPMDENGLKTSADAVRSFSKSIHIDIDDELFAPVRTWPYTSPGVWGTFDLSGAKDLEADIHLMVQEPREIGIAFARAGAIRIMGHIEAFKNHDEARNALDEWRNNGAREAGLGILMGTPLDLLDPLVSIIDVVHMMSIATIGTQGILYQPDAPARIAEFHSRHPELLISVDGGVSEQNITELARAGARRFGVGAAIARASNPADAYKRLRSLAEAARV